MYMKNKNDFRKGRRKLIAMLTVFLVSISVVVGGSLMLFYLQQTSDITVSETLFTWDDVAMSQLETSEDFSGVPGETVEYFHWLNCSDSASGDMDILFTISDAGLEPAEGIDFTVYYEDGGWIQIVNDTVGSAVFTISPDQNVSIKHEYVFDEYILASSDYQYTLVLEKNS